LAYAHENGCSIDVEKYLENLVNIILCN